MKFEKMLLDDYMQTPDGERVTEFFRNLKASYRNRFKDGAFFRFVDSLLTLPHQDHFFGGDPDDDRRVSPEAGTPADIEEFVETMAVGFDDEQQAHNFLDYVPTYSMQLALKYPKFAFPYLFLRDFHKMKLICEIFGIPIPLVPGRTRYSERFNYYLELCRALYEFRMEHGMSPLELQVFLYGFAVRFVGDFIDNAYGAANRVYIVGATAYDVEEGALRKPTDRSVSTWQGNVDMLPGDIVIVYETRPYSRIRTIWRAVSPGFDDPFTYYPGSVYLGHPVLVPSVTLNDLRSDPVWSKKGLVRASMQGVNGKTCTVEEYEALKRMFGRNDPGFDLRKVPSPPPYARFYHEDLKVERDVEEQLLEPLLRKIGHAKWVRQLPLRMGRGDRVFPDYALGVTGRGDDASAEYIWEAKYRIPTAKQLRIDFGQAKSYALRLQSRALGLISIEGVWFVSAGEGFRFERLRHFSWEQLASPDALAELKQVFRSPVRRGAFSSLALHG